MKSEEEWKKETADMISAKKQSPFMDMVDCFEAWDNRHADEADEALDEIDDALLHPNKERDLIHVMACVAYLRQFVKRTRK